MTGAHLRGGFSLVELLMVISIIALLMAILLPVSGMLRRQARAQQTRGAMLGMLHAMQTWSATKGGSIQPSEHPLAGSAPTRAAFVRGDTYTAVGTTGTAFVGASLSQLTSAGDKPNLLLPTDLFADATTPLLFGMARNRIGLLGVPAPGVTSYRLLPAKGSIPSATTTGTLVQPNDPVSATAELLDMILAERRKDLAAQGFLVAPANDTSLIAGSRVWGPTVASGWKVPPTTGGVMYQIRGVAFYDGWGREILYSLNTQGYPRFESAGPDGYFRWNSGKDKILQTSAWATTPSGDDLDASRDNIKVGFAAGE